MIYVVDSDVTVIDEDGGIRFPQLLELECFHQKLILARQLVTISLPR
jgi:hypothetical protein